MHKRISTSKERSQAEQGECWPAGLSQSLSPRRGGSSRTRRNREEEKVGETTDRNID